MFNSKQSENSHRASKKEKMVLSVLIIIFLAITLLVVSNNSFIISLDNSIHGWIANHQSPSVSNLMSSITKVCNNLETVIIFLIFGLFLFLKNRKSLKIFIFTSFSGVVLTEVIKYSVQRARPFNLLEQGPSFPSFHATIATVFLLSSVYLLAPLMFKNYSRRIFVLATSIVFTLVAFSRIYLSVHWTSDVIAGIVLGLICFISSSLIYCYKKENVL